MPKLKPTHIPDSPQSSAEPSQKGYVVGGVLLGIAAIINTYYGIERFGLESGRYWWFCNLANSATAISLILRNRTFLLGFLSISCFTQIFWIVDNVWRLFTGSNLFGLVEYLYEPGFPMGQFVLSHYHYFTIPTTAIALYFMPKFKSKAFWAVLFANPFIFYVSYLFPAEQNVNCIHEACVGWLSNWKGLSYSFGFFGIIFVMHLLAVTFVERLFLKVKRSKKADKIALYSFLSVIGIAFALTAGDVVYKSKLPRLYVESGDNVDFRYTLDFAPNQLSMVYEVHNPNFTPQVCEVWGESGGLQQRLATDIAVPANDKTKVRNVIAYPTTDLRLRLFATCKVAS